MIQNLIFLSCFNANAVGNVHANAKPIYQFEVCYCCIFFPHKDGSKKFYPFFFNFTCVNFFQIVQKELLLSHENELLEMEHSGLHVLLRDGKVCLYPNNIISKIFWIWFWLDVWWISNADVPQVEDLKRMYELFHCIDGGLDPILSIFKQVPLFPTSTTLPTFPSLPTLWSLSVSQWWLWLAWNNLLNCIGPEIPG